MLCGGCQITLATAIEMVVNQKKGREIWGGEKAVKQQRGAIATVEEE